MVFGWCVRSGNAAHSGKGRAVSIHNMDRLVEDVAMLSKMLSKMAWYWRMKRWFVLTERD